MPNNVHFYVFKKMNKDGLMLYTVSVMCRIILHGHSFLKMLDAFGLSSVQSAYYKKKTQRSQNQINIERKESPKQHHLFQFFKHRAEGLK